MTRVKICGIKEETHALAAVDAGADFIGLVFAPSKRQVTPAQAEKLATAVKNSGVTTEVVGIFVNMPADELNEIADACHLDWIQLSGNESWGYCNKITRPIIKIVRIGKKQCADEIYANITGSDRLISGQHIYILDTYSRDKYGGTGVSFDWNLARLTTQQYPVIIAGGLNPENVTQVIRIAAPWGVDTSSGVETNGLKDIKKIQAFIKAVRRTDDR
jgi:phosphoribosylanthranilate isomerase